MSIFKKSCAVLCSLALTVGMIAPVSAEDETIAMRDMTTQEIVEDMGLGINLGNTFESCGSWISDSSVTNYETGWGSPVITQEMINGYASEGFGVLRVPVAWSNMMGEDYTINADYIARVREVCDWAIDSGMYVILNIHYDGGWWSGFSDDDTKDECMYRYERMWTQLCEAFGDESDYMMFESLNEEGAWDDIWNRYSNVTNARKEKAYALLNEINQKFVDIVRESGGNNAKRHLLIAGYGTDVDLTCDELFEMPNDPENRCAVSVHYYTPSTFCILEEDADWGKAQTTWGTDEEVLAMKKDMAKLVNRFVDNGVPVIIGEYGVSIKNKEMSEIRNFLSQVADEAYSAGMCPVVWDINYTETDLHDKSVYDRLTCTMNDEELKLAYANIIADGRDYVALPEDDSSEVDSEVDSDIESEVDSDTDSDTDSNSESEVDSTVETSSVNSVADSSSQATTSSSKNPSTGTAVAISGLTVCLALIVVANRKKK